MCSKKEDEKSSSISLSVIRMTSEDISKGDNKETILIKTTTKRYLILLLFVTLAAIKGFQWICVSSITNVISRYYNVSNIAVNWTTGLFMVTYFILALPVTALIENIGLRRSILIGGFGTTIGLITKCFSVYPNGFFISFMGHLFIGLSEPFFFAVYSKLAFIWFPDEQVGLATSIGIMGDEIGVALGFIIPTLMVGNNLDDIERIEWGLQTLYLVMAILASVNVFFIVIFFDEQPEHAPGFARFRKLVEERRASQNLSSYMRFKAFFETTFKFFKKRNFNLMFLSCGINIGIAYAHHTLLNQMIDEGGESKYSNPIFVTGNVGLILLVSGILGSFVCGALLDKFHAYKLLNVSTYALCLVSLGAFTACLGSTNNNEIILYLTTVPLGFFTIGYQCCAVEYAVEVTYPESEIISSTLLIVSGQLFGLIITFVGSGIVDDYGSVVGCMFLGLIMFFGLISVSITKHDCKRQQAVESSRQNSEAFQAIKA